MNEHYTTILADWIMSGRPATENGVAGMSARVTPGRPLTRHPTAPDGGWGWWVMLSSFVLQWLAGGVTFTFGVLYVDLLEEFHEDDAVTAFIGSMQSFITFLAGKLLTHLLNRYCPFTLTRNNWCGMALFAY